MHYLKAFDKVQLWRFFVDGRFQKKYDGWVGYEAGERGSVQAMMNGFAFMLDNFDLSQGLSSTYLLDLHKICMLNVETRNLKSSPGDLRYLNAGMPFFAKSTTYENLKQILHERAGDGTIIFNTKKYAKTADEFDVDELYAGLLKDKRINYRNWYPNLDKRTQDAIDKKGTLQEFYIAKHYVQMLFANKMDEIVQQFNNDIRLAQDQEEQLDSMIELIRHLELLHPFPDGNCRTFASITLNHLLLYYGFIPAILYNPNYDGELSSQEFKQHIREGMAVTETLLANKESTVYNYAISQMRAKDKKSFLKMASKMIRKIEAHNEVYLTPERAARLCDGKWFHVDNYMRFAKVGDYNTFIKDSLYFMLALKEWKNEGRNIEMEIERLSSKGVRAIVTDDEKLVSMTSLPVLLVKDIKKAYVSAATQVRQEVGCKTLLITGTEGKTGAKSQLHQLLSSQTKVHANISSANTEIPVLRSLINLREEDQVELNEVSVGSNESLRVERTKWVNPDLCLFTHIGPNHMDMHKTIENIITAKSSVVEGLRDDGICIVNSDMEYYQDLINDIERRRPGTKIVTFGSSKTDEGQLYSTEFNLDKYGWDVSAVIEGTAYKYFVPLLQAYTPLASVGILLCVSRLGYDVGKAALAYSHVLPYDTMGQLTTLHKKEGDVVFYDQSRRGGISGMQSAFDDLARMKKKGKVIALVGGISIKKDSEWTRESHTQLAELINNSPIDRLYTTGPFMDYVHTNLTIPQVAHSDDLNVLAKTLLDEVQPGDTLFIIGSAYLYLGRVSEMILSACEHELFDRHTPLRIPEQKQESLFHQKFIQSGTKDILAFKTETLLSFFDSFKDIMDKQYNFKCIDTLLSSKDQKSVYNKQYCRSWFFNNTPMKKEQGHQLFGSFFDVGHRELLLHIHLGTHNLHIGLVQYSKLEEGISLDNMSEADTKNVVEKFNVLSPRKWWLGWCSTDCGQVIDLEDNDAFLLLENFEESDCFKNHLVPLLKLLEKSE